MTLTLHTKNQCRLVPVRFERATSSAPAAQYPDIDNRGFANKVPAMNGLPASAALCSPVMSLAVNQAATIKLVKQNIAPTAPLHITSSNTAIVNVTVPAANAKCADGPFALVNIKAGIFKGETPKVVSLEVRFGSASGAIISKLTIYVLPVLVVNIQPHLITIDAKNGTSGHTPKCQLAETMAVVSAIWFNSGIQLSVAKPVSLSISLQQENVVAVNENVNEMNELLGLKWTNDSINLYIVNAIEGNDSYTVNAQEYSYQGLLRPAIFFGMMGKGDQSQQANRSNQLGQLSQRHTDIHQCANDLAHQIGQFFGLQPTHEQDTWSMRSLMHAVNLNRRPPAPSAKWQTYNDVGYGQTSDKRTYRGALIPLKALPFGNSSGASTQTASSQAAGNQASCSQARNYILRGCKHLYS